MTGSEAKADEVLEGLKAERKRRQTTHWLRIAVVLECFLLALSLPAATVVLLIGTVLTFWRRHADKSFRFRRLPFDVPILIFAGFGAVSILVSPDPAFSFYNYYHLVGAYLLMYFLLGQNVRTQQDFQAVLMAFLASAVIVAAYGWFQFFFGIDATDIDWVDAEQFPELKKRVFSTWENPNILAGYLDIVICLAFGLFLKLKEAGQRLLLAALMLLMTGCLAMTYARGACFTLAVILAGYGLLRDRRIFVACLVFFALLLVMDTSLANRLLSVFTTVDTSTEMRFAFWESTLAMIQDHPFFGIGWGAYWMVYPAYDFYMQGVAGTTVRIVHAHNIYLNYAAEIGVLGALAFCWFFFGTMKMALCTHVKTDEELAREAEGEAKEKKPAAAELDDANAADQELLRIEKMKEQNRSREAPKEQVVLGMPWYGFKLRISENMRRVYGGMMLGLGLGFVSIALNGLTDDLLFNIPMSMTMWGMLALTAGISRNVRESRQACGRSEGETVHE